MYKIYTGKIRYIIICILIQTSFCVLDFMFTAYGPNSANVARTT